MCSLCVFDVQNFFIVGCIAKIVIRTWDRVRTRRTSTFSNANWGNFQVFIEMWTNGQMYLDAPGQMYIKTVQCKQLDCALEDYAVCSMVTLEIHQILAFL